MQRQKSSHKYLSFGPTNTNTLRALSRAQLLCGATSLSNEATAFFFRGPAPHAIFFTAGKRVLET
jgi:hypothetical protein